ncbi:hypothetical protein FACS189496_3320 [Bacilli bacterium]|nr:hypothetical protein FACS189496_3320 [Bacilli bacterium]
MIISKNNIYNFNMELNLKKIFLSQQKLNEVILKKANKSYDEVKNELKLALLVELAELANEVKSFKY